MDSYNDHQESKQEPQSDLTPEEIAEKFANAKRNQLLMLIPLVIAFILLFSATDNPDFHFLGMSSGIITTIAMLVIVGAIIFSFKNWRCPACKSYLGRSGGHKFCPKCGAKFIIDHE